MIGAEIDHLASLEHLARLHEAGVAHKSVHPRNVVIQEGPLTVAPKQRSTEHPNVRFVGLGDSYLLECFLDGGDITKEDAEEDFAELCQLDWKQLRPTCHRPTGLRSISTGKRRPAPE